jgi:hypothetical protein
LYRKSDDGHHFIEKVLPFAFYPFSAYKAKTATAAARTRPPKLAAMLEALPVEGSTEVPFMPVGEATRVDMAPVPVAWTAVVLLGIS